MTTMYMHTLDGMPASYTEEFGGYIHFVSGRNKVRLEQSLSDIRRQQRTDILNKASLSPVEYGYVLVEVNP